MGGIASLPPKIVTKLGDIDKTSYQSTDAFGAVALQFTKAGEPDFYLIGEEVFVRSYKETPFADVVEKNAQLAGAFQEYFKESTPVGVKAVLKVSPVTMFSTVDLGVSASDEMKIEAPWGSTQEKSPGVNAWVVENGSQYYLCNSDDDGMPINYLKAGA